MIMIIHQRRKFFLLLLQLELVRWWCSHAWLLRSQYPITKILGSRSSSRLFKIETPSSFQLLLRNSAPSSDANGSLSSEENELDQVGQRSSYDLGADKNEPLAPSKTTKLRNKKEAPSLDDLHWNVPKAVDKPKVDTSKKAAAVAAAAAVASVSRSKQQRRPRQSRKLIPAETEDARRFKGAVPEELIFNSDSEELPKPIIDDINVKKNDESSPFPKPNLQYPDIDLSIPDSVYSNTTDVVWDLLRWEAYQEAQREPLLVSFLYSNILNHRSLESSLAFLLANRLSSAAMISTQIQSLILDAFAADPTVGRSLRADIMAVRDRDPACTCLPDVFLYFKGFHALQTYRVAHSMWKEQKTVLAHYLQSQVSQIFQIDIHPNATLGRGIMLDHGTGIVIGETAHVGHNCSILHHVTLGGSGKKGVDRHPKVGNGVLLGAGASILGNVKLGDGCQVGAGTLVIADLPSHSVAVGVPAKIIGKFVNEEEQPSIGMNQMMDSQSITERTFLSEGI